MDCYDSEIDSYTHEFYGVMSPNGSGVARTVQGSGFFGIADAESFASRFGGRVVWC